jgi:ribose-phosphate pyrophosphokinase
VNTYTIRIAIDEGVLYEKIKYPAGEVQMRMTEKQAEQLRDRDVIVVISRGDLMETALLLDMIYSYSHRAPKLVLPYLPYARADRRFTQADCFGLFVYSQMLNTMFCREIYAVDVHSAVTTALTRVKNISVDPIINTIVHGLRDVTVLLPDKGSIGRYSILPGVPVLHCEKNRDQITGKLVGFEVPHIETSRALIVDDICDGGGTFNGIAATINRQQGDSVKLFLYVTHGIFSKGLIELNQNFSQIFCTDAFPLRLLAKVSLEIFPVQALIDATLARKEPEPVFGVSATDKI